MSDIQPDETVDADEAEELMADVFPGDFTMRFEEGKILLEADEEDFTVTMISAREDPTLDVDAQGKGMATVSRLLIEKDGTLYEQETDGPFTFEAPGMGEVLPE